MQSLSSSAKMDTQQKQEVLAKIENCSKREAQEILANYFPEATELAKKSKESLRILNSDEASLHLRLSKETLSKLDRIRKLRAHKNPNMNYVKLIDDMCDFVLRKIDPNLKVAMSKIEMKSRSSNPRYIPAKLKATIYKRDQSQCCFIDKQTARRCTSKHLLQIDHRLPVSRGGQSEVDNLQLLCQPHHKYKDQYV
ncbi:MAG: HNH endonuclease [Bdellovibrionota bacterium]